MGKMGEVTMLPIGQVVEGRTGADDEGWEEAEAVLEIEPAWTDALDGLEGFSHIWVLWHLDRSPGPPLALKVHPERRPEIPETGLFATRSPQRPNPIAMTAVRLLDRDGGRLRVRGLDAFQGSPVLDLKPYLRRGDLITEAVMPSWIEALWRSHDENRDQGATTG